MIKLLTENWGTKLVSLILAVGLWYYAVGEEGIQINRTIPIEIKVENEKMSIVGKPTRVVLATLEAPRSLLPNLASEELKAVHVIKKVESPGDYSFRVEPREILLPSEKIRVVRIEPEVIQVKIDEIMVQKLEVDPVFLGEPAFGYQLDKEKVQMDPTSVLVEGPKSQLEKIGKIKTQPIDIVGRVRSFRKTVRLAEEPGLKPLSESLVDVYVPVQEVLSEKLIENVPLKILGVQASFNRVSLESTQLNLTLRGSPKALEPVQTKDILAYVDISGLAEGSHELEVQVILPEGTYLKEKLPHAKVNIQKRGNSLFQA